MLIFVQNDNMSDEKIKTLNRDERFVCEILWGNVPVDVQWARNSKIFIEGRRKFERGEYSKILDYVSKSITSS